MDYGPEFVSDTNKEEEERQVILKTSDLSVAQAKVIILDVNESDIQEITDLLNKKIHELKFKLITFDPLTLCRMTAKEFVEEFNKYTKQLSVEYNVYGLKRIYDKIDRIIKIIPFDGKYTKDIEIIEEIKNEYIMTKKLNKSSMLYLNKIYRELTQEKEDEETKCVTREQLDRLQDFD